MNFVHERGTSTVLYLNPFTEGDILRVFIIIARGRGVCVFGKDFTENLHAILY